MHIISTNAQSRIVAMIPDEYLWIIAIILSGIYLPIKADTSGRPILYLINVRILKEISIIAIAKTNDENLLKNITTSRISSINIIKSIYINNTSIPYIYFNIKNMMFLDINFYSKMFLSFEL